MADTVFILLLFVIWFAMGWMARDCQADIEWNREHGIGGEDRA